MTRRHFPSASGATGSMAHTSACRPLGHITSGGKYHTRFYTTMVTARVTCHKCHQTERFQQERERQLRDANEPRPDDTPAIEGRYETESAGTEARLYRCGRCGLVGVYELCIHCGVNGTPLSAETVAAYIERGHAAFKE